MKDADVATRSSDKVREETNQASSRILEIINLKGKITEPGAMTQRCSDYAPEENIYRASHPWSMYDVPIADMEEAMERLRRDFPKGGWKIVKDGPDSSQGKSPQIIADSVNGEFSADIRLHHSSEQPNQKPLLEVTVASSCYRSK